MNSSAHEPPTPLSSRRPVHDDVAVLDAVRGDARYTQHLDWGRPRAGHPEGTIRAHIAELERNLAALGDRLSNDATNRIRLLVHVHDTFKPESAHGVAIDDPRSHASLAKEFLAEFTDDAELLAMVQWHDLPYALWRKARRTGTLDEKRFTILEREITDWETFVAFLIVDGCTAGKSREPLEWFLGQIAGRIDVSWTVDDLLPDDLDAESARTGEPVTES